VSDRVRLFAALELPEEVRSELHAWGLQAAAREPELRVLAPDALHVTLVFLDWQATEVVEEIGAAVRAAARALPALKVTGAAWLPPRRPGVLVVDLAPQPSIVELQADLVADLSGYHEPETRPFRPHVTVARVPRGKRVRSLDVADPAGLTFSSTGLVLYRSHMGRGGSRYEVVARA
jgi:RNA 2',3'-cyclic 3'-phosphodiesterase